MCLVVAVLCSRRVIAMKDTFDCEYCGGKFPRDGVENHQHGRGFLCCDCFYALFENNICYDDKMQLRDVNSLTGSEEEVEEDACEQCDLTIHQVCFLSICRSCSCKCCDHCSSVCSDCGYRYCYGDEGCMDDGGSEGASAVRCASCAEAHSVVVPTYQAYKMQRVDS